MSTSESTHRNERRVILLDATFEDKTSSYCRLIEASGYTVSAALISGLPFEILTSKKCDWPAAELDDTGLIWESESITFNGSNCRIDQLQNLMMEAGFHNSNHLLLMVTPIKLDFYSLVHIC